MEKKNLKKPREKFSLFERAQNGALGSAPTLCPRPGARFFSQAEAREEMIGLPQSAHPGAQGCTTGQQGKTITTSHTSHT